MIVKTITEAVIYEDTAGDETVYIKESGKHLRQLHSDDPAKKTLLDTIEEDRLWGNIRRAAKTNATIQRALDEAELLYNLSK